MSDAKMQREMKIIIAGGGTGGHIFPAIAIANAIKAFAPNTKFLFLGAKGKMEMEKVPQAGYEIKGLNIAGFNRSSLIKNISLPIKLMQSFMQVAQIFRSFRPDAVLGVGGYSSFPVLRFAQSKGIPTFIHESNSFAGKSNIMLGKKASMVFTAAGDMEHFFPAKKIIQTGNPVRKTISDSVITKEEACRYFGLDATKKTILVVGGSLGARSVNEAIAKGLEEISSGSFQLIWQTGKPYFEEAEQVVKGKEGIYMNSFITQMEYAYAAADVVVSRSGAMAVAELCLVKKPVIFVPYPFAAEDHQTANAKALENKKAALMVTDKNVGTELMPALIKLLNDKEKQQQLINNITALAIANADEVIAKYIIDRIN